MHLPDKKVAQNIAATFFINANKILALYQWRYLNSSKFRKKVGVGYEPVHFFSFNSGISKRQKAQFTSVKNV